MYEKVEFPAVLVFARTDKEAHCVRVFPDGKVLNGDEELQARLGMMMALEEAGGLHYEMTLVEEHRIEEVMEERRRWLEYAQGWGPNPEKDEAADAPTSPAPESTPDDPRQVVDSSDPTTEPAELQMATLVVRYDFTPPPPCNTHATGLLLSIEGAARMHNTAQTRLELCRLGYVPDYSKWVVLDRGGKHIRRREVYIKPNGNGDGEPATDQSTLWPDLANSDIQRTKPFTEEDRVRIMALARERNPNFQEWDPAKPDSWYRRNASPWSLGWSYH